MVWNKFFRRCVEGFIGYCRFVDTRLWSWSCSIVKQVSRPVAISYESGSMLSTEPSFYTNAFSIKYAEFVKPRIVDYHFFSPLILFQVTQGTSEFKPTPPENREFFRKSYSVPHTLLVISQILNFLKHHLISASCYKSWLRLISNGVILVLLSGKVQCRWHRWDRHTGRHFETSRWSHPRHDREGDIGREPSHPMSAGTYSSTHRYSISLSSW